MLIIIHTHKFLNVSPYGVGIGSELILVQICWLKRHMFLFHFLKCLFFKRTHFLPSWGEFFHSETVLLFKHFCSVKNNNNKDLNHYNFIISQLWLTLLIREVQWFYWTQELLVPVETFSVRMPMMGCELTTPWLQTKCSSHWAIQ